MFNRVNKMTGIRKLLPVILAGSLSYQLSAQGDSIGFPGDWNAYPAHYEYLDFLHGLLAEYPDICRLDTLGMSIGGRPIMVLKITDNPDIREPEPAFYYSSTMHGDETSGFMLLLRLVDHICRNYGQDPLCTRLVDSVEIWINPLANPDGTYGSNDSIISSPIRENGNGKDLNRNFPSPVSGVVDNEPETLSQMNFMENIHLVLAANIHDGDEVFNYPWDTWYSYEVQHADSEWYIQAGRKYVDTVHVRTFLVPGYMSGFDNGITHGADWYRIFGGRQDYVNYFLHAREITLEISQDKFPANKDDLSFLWYANQTSLLQYMENSLFGIQGIVTDSITGNPVKSWITVMDHDKDESMVFSDSTTGYFARLIEPGTWVLEITAEGYKQKKISHIEVERDIATHLSIVLEPYPESIRPPVRVEAWPNPWTMETQIRFQVNIPGPRRILLIGVDGRILKQDQISCPRPGAYQYNLDGNMVEPGWYVLHLQSVEGILSVKLLRSE
jgi:hypothetical protein